MPNEEGKKNALHKKHVARLQREQQQVRIVLYTFVGILAAVALLLIYGWLDIKYFQARRPVAKVGNVEILVKDFEPRVRLQRQQLLSQYNLYAQYQQFGMNVETQLQQIQANLDNPAIVGQTVLDQMINEELVRQEAAKRGITVDEAELDKALETSFNYFPNGTPSPTTTPTAVTLPKDPAEAFAIVSKTPAPTHTPAITATAEITATATIAQPTATAGPSSTPEPTATPYTLEGFQSEVDTANQRMMKLGFEDQIFRKFFEAQLLETKLQEVLSAEISPTQLQVWARHILVADEQAAKDIIVRLQDGEDFATLARELSTDTGSGLNGGDLGWFGSGAMVPEFEAAAFGLKNPGDITTEPVKSDFGYHIIQLIARQDRPLTADQYQTAKQKAFADWLVAAKEEYGVETFDVWKSRVPTEPNFITAATEAADAQLTAQAEALQNLEGTATPKP